VGNCHRGKKGAKGRHLLTKSRKRTYLSVKKALIASGKKNRKKLNIDSLYGEKKRKKETEEMFLRTLKGRGEMPAVGELTMVGESVKEEEIIRPGDGKT